MKFELRERPIVRPLPDGNVLLYVNECLTTVNSTAHAILAHAINLGKGDIEVLVQKFAEEFEAPTDLLRKDIIQTLSALERIGVVKLSVDSQLQKGTTAREIFSERTAKPRIPVYIAWNLTAKCNLTCEFCYSRGRKGHLSFKESRECLRRLIEAGVMEIGFGGGECFLYPRFVDLVREAADNDIRVTVTTHGGLLDENTLELLPQAGFASIGISFDAARAERHDALRGQGAFASAVRSARRIVTYGIPLDLVTVITRESASEVCDIAVLGSALGARRVYFKEFKAVGNGAKNFARFGLSLDEKIAVWQRILDFAPQIPNVELDFGVNSEPAANAHFGDGTVSACSCGSMSACLRENGNITACSYNDYAIGNLLEESLEAIWSRVTFAAPARPGRVGMCGAEDYLTKGEFPGLQVAGSIVARQVA